MLINKIKTFNRHIKYYGFFNYILLKKTEMFYTSKFRKLGIQEPGNTNFEATLNEIALIKDARRNQSSYYRAIKKSFDITGINDSGINLLDIGCGYGRVLSFGMMLNFNQVMGIDLDQSALKYANANCKKMQQHGHNTIFKIYNADASTFEIPNETNLIFLSNPFGKDTMQKVLKNIVTHCKMQKKDLFVIYSVPVFQKLFENVTGCTKIYESFNGDKTNSEMAIFKISG